MTRTADAVAIAVPSHKRIRYALPSTAPNVPAVFDAAAVLNTEPSAEDWRHAVDVTLKLRIAVSHSAYANRPCRQRANRHYPPYPGPSNWR